MASKLKSTYIRRDTENIGWKQTGITFEGWIEIQTMTNKKNFKLLPPRYMKIIDYEDVMRYPSNIPAYFIEKIIDSGIKIPNLLLNRNENV